MSAPSAATSCGFFPDGQQEQRPVRTSAGNLLRMNLDRVGRSGIHYAAAEGRLVDVAQALHAGANSGQPDANGWTPLHLAAQGQHADVAEALIRAGAPIDAADAYGKTPAFGRPVQCPSRRGTGRPGAAGCRRRSGREEPQRHQPARPCANPREPRPPAVPGGQVTADPRCRRGGVEQVRRQPVVATAS